MGHRLPEMAVEFLLQETYELVATPNDMAWLNSLQLENDVGMDNVAQLLERVLAEQREVAPRQALAFGRSSCAALRDVEKYEPQRCKPSTVEPQPAWRLRVTWARLDSNQGPTDYESAALTS